MSPESLSVTEAAQTSGRDAMVKRVVTLGVANKHPSLILWAIAASRPSVSKIGTTASRTIGRPHLDAALITGTAFPGKRTLRNTDVSHVS